MNFNCDSGWHYMLLNFSSHQQKYMDINILHNLEKQGLIVRKLLVPIPILLFSDEKKKKD